MRKMPTYKNMIELIKELRLIKTQGLQGEELFFFPIQPVRVGDKIGFVNWENCKLECLPIFDDFDRLFASYQDCICVRQGDKWGVLNAYSRYELPIEYSYSVANQVCRVMNRQQLEGQSIRKYGTYMKFS